MPDLILISATGGDSALALYDQLSAIAPTLVINYMTLKLAEFAHAAWRDHRREETGRGARIANLRGTTDDG